jgi:hypothetical protein
MEDLTGLANSDWDLEYLHREQCRADEMDVD